MMRDTIQFTTSIDYTQLYGDESRVIGRQETQLFLQVVNDLGFLVMLSRFIGLQQVSNAFVWTCCSLVQRLAVLVPRQVLVPDTVLVPIDTGPGTDVGPGTRVHSFSIPSYTEGADM
jgi:hypothetical protein